MDNNSIEKLKSIANLIPLLTILTFVYGYIGFHTFTTIYQIPVISTDISTIASIGLFNLTYMAMLYFAASPKRPPYYVEALLIYIIFLFFLNNPTIIASLLVIQLIWSGMFIIKPPQRASFKELKEKVNKYKLRAPLYDIIIAVIGVIVIFIFDSDYFTLLIFLYVLLSIFHRYKKYKIRFDLFTLAAIILFPVVTMFYFINNSNSNILGLNKQSAKIITTSSDTLSTTIIFSDDNCYYLHNDSLKTVTTLNKNDVRSMVTTSQERPKGNLIELTKRLFSR